MNKGILFRIAIIFAIVAGWGSACSVSRCRSPGPDVEVPIDIDVDADSS